jgi:Ferritin-like domain
VSDLITLEFLETAFYKEARAKAGLRGETAQFAKVAGAHEAAHVKALQGVLKSAAVKSPRFNFGGATAGQAAFQKAAMAIEDLGVNPAPVAFDPARSMSQVLAVAGGFIVKA